MNILKKIFSVENVKNGSNNSHKVFTVLGIKMSFSNKQKSTNILKFLFCENELQKMRKELDSLNTSNKKLKNYCETLKFMMDSCCDITKCKPATGNFRQLQIVRLKFLMLFKKICEKHNLTYWLDFGSLIGVYRHKGFIPWDDDIDISMDVRSYFKLPDIVNSELNEYGIEAQIGTRGKTCILRVMDMKDGFIYTDVFPFKYANNPNLSKEEMFEKLTKIRKDFWNKYSKDDFNSGRYNIRDKYEELLGMYKNAGINVQDEEGGTYLFRDIISMSNNKMQSIHYIDNVLPFQDGDFDGIKAKIPNRILEYLDEADNGNYGNIMLFPSLASNYTTHSATKQSGNDDFEKRMSAKENVMDKLLEIYK